MFWWCLFGNFSTTWEFQWFFSISISSTIFFIGLNFSPYRFRRGWWRREIPVAMWSAPLANPYGVTPSRLGIWLVSKNVICSGLTIYLCQGALALWSTKERPKQKPKNWSQHSTTNPLKSWQPNSLTVFRARPSSTYRPDQVIGPCMPSVREFHTLGLLWQICIRTCCWKSWYPKPWMQWWTAMMFSTMPLLQLQCWTLLTRMTRKARCEK